MKNRSTKITLLTACFVSAASLLQAAVISINFAGDDQGAPYQYTITGPAGIQGATNWQNYYNAGGLYGNGQHNNIATDSGASEVYINYVGTNVVDPAVPGSGAVWGLGTLAAAVPSANAGIFNNYLNYFNPVGDGGGQIYFGNLGSAFSMGAFTTYDVVVYFTNPYNTTLSIYLNDGITAYAKYANVVAGTPFSGFVESTATSFGDATTANYVRFSGLTSANFGIFGEGTSAYPAISGIQIISVPEPSAYALLIGAVGCVMLFRRRSSQGAVGA